MNIVTRNKVSRISISLPETLLDQFDNMVCERGFESRSQAMAEMINNQLADHQQEMGEKVMAGTINLVYDHSVPGLQSRLNHLQHIYIDEIISSLNINLVQMQTLQVVLVQGPARKLKMIADKMISCKGVLSGRLLMSTAIIPPIHPLSE
ncbi:nickel-responsive transcriptional regulator NikR [Thiohalophilus sp.]|uniref:nickel-responsive transcriptional regulator NikR n=1 Tax=Thiohalophilus sp. TaxID=3028392 RepID=UPI003976136B